MALSSSNGYSVSPPLDNRVVAGSDGVKLAPGVRAGAVATVLFYVAARLNLVVERGVQGWCWGYAYRAIRGTSSTVSFHASGTAFDWNAPKHPLGKRGTWSESQRQILAAITRDCRGLIRFGEFYGNRVDGMHCEIVGNENDVRKLAEAILRGELPGGVDGANGNAVAGTVPVVAIVPKPVVLAGPTAPPAVVEKGVRAPAFPLRGGQYFGPRDPKSNVNSISGYFSHREDLRVWQDRMKYRGWTITPDGLYGEEVERVARAFQRDKGLDCDGLVGPATWDQAWTADITR